MKIRMRAAAVLTASALAITAGLTGCSRTEERPARKNQLKIGVTLYDQYDVFLSEMMNSFNNAVFSKRAETGEEIIVETYNAKQSQPAQNGQVDEMIQDGCDVICVNLVDRTAPSDIIDAARKADVPIIFFNRELVEEDLLQWKKLYYVGANAYESGRMQGELAADAVQDPERKVDKNGDGMIQYVVLEGEAGHQDAVARSEQSVKRLIELGVKLDKLGYAIANWDYAQAETQMSKFIEQNKNRIELVLANNDDMALGAMEAYRTSGIRESEWPVIFGVDGTMAGRQAVKDGTLTGTVYNDGTGQANAMFRLAYAIGTGDSLKGIGLEGDKYIRLPYAKITPENIAAFEN